MSTGPASGKAEPVFPIAHTHAANTASHADQRREKTASEGTHTTRHHTHTNVSSKDYLIRFLWLLRTEGHWRVRKRETLNAVQALFSSSQKTSVFSMLF